VPEYVAVPPSRVICVLGRSVESLASFGGFAQAALFGSALAQLRIESASLSPASASASALLCALLRTDWCELLTV
jgi:hypothetical protein